MKTMATTMTLLYYSRAVKNRTEKTRMLALKKKKKKEFTRVTLKNCVLNELFPVKLFQRTVLSLLSPGSLNSPEKKKDLSRGSHKNQNKRIF